MPAVDSPAMNPVPLARYVQHLYPEIDAAQLARETFQAIQLPISSTRSDRLDAIKLAQECFAPTDEPRVALISQGNVTLATVDPRAWRIYLQTPVPRGTWPECERARREIADAVRGLQDADLSRDSPWDVIAKLAHAMAPRSTIASSAWMSIGAGHLGFVGIDPQSRAMLEEIAFLKVREAELVALRRAHLQAFLAGQAPFDGIGA